ncbi:MAG: hypothetical protein CL609_25835 [Anaerolineaceae bacterium]|nr:hypothetical protein [Anaerolineaceae bacterium]
MKKLQILFTVILITSFWWVFPPNSTGSAAPLQEVSAQDLINLINGLRVGQGLPALTVDSTLMATAQSTSDTMAVNDLHWHIGGVSERVQAAGFGGGAKVWATENFAIGPMTIDRIQQVWADESHMIPVVNPAYTHIGAGVTEYNGRVWYIVHAAYVGGGSSYVAPTSVSQPGVPAITNTPPISQIVIPVQTATPNPGGAVIHEVKSGQSLWSIAIAYDTKIADLVRLNNLSGDTPTIYTGQKIIVVAGEATATPDPNITETTGQPTGTVIPTSTPTQMAPTATRTKLPTGTPTPQVEITAAVTETVTETPKTTAGISQIMIFNNKTVGIILISSLALGILLMITGAVQKTKN